MKRLLLPLLTAVTLPTAVNADYYSNEVDPMTDKSVIILGITSNENKKVGLGIFCKGSKKVQATLLTDNVLDELNFVDIRWDKEKPKEYFWKAAKNRKIFLLGFSGFSGRKQANRYVKEFREHSSMIVRYPTWIDGQQTVTFDLKRFHPLIDRAESEGCAF